MLDILNVLQEENEMHYVYVFKKIIYLLVIISKYFLGIVHLYLLSVSVYTFIVFILFI